MTDFLTSIKLLILLTLLLNVISLNSQSCADGSYNWEDIQTIFIESHCTSCHTGNTVTNGQSQLSFDDYELFLDGGVICGTGILDGTTLVDIITFGIVPCNNGIDTVYPAMNGLALKEISDDDLMEIQSWIDEGYKEFCDSTITTIQTFDINQISIYPNPTKNWITISIEDHDVQIESIQIYNSSGDYINTEFSQNLNQNTFEISELSKGLYYLKIPKTKGLYKLVKL